MSRIGVARRGLRRRCRVRAVADQLDAARGAAEDLLHVGCGYPGRYLTRGWHEAALKVPLRRWTHGDATVPASVARPRSGRWAGTGKTECGIHA
jgi:hypothetical protein